MEEKIINMNQFLGAAQGDQEHMLGKFLYFSLANLLVDKDELSSLCESMGIPYTGSTRLSLGDAFRSATGDIRERVPVTVDGETNIYLAYCRDNKRTAGVFSRELVKETLNRETNRYEKLANISCGKNDGMFRCDNLVLDDAVDVQGCCRKAEELFELYLIKSSSQSPAVMDRWVLKVQALEEKKRHYEGVLQRELDGLDDEFSVLKLLSQELQVRANSIRSQRFQQKAA